MPSATIHEHSTLTTELAGISALPNLKQRWTVRRKAAVVEAVRGGSLPIEHACTVYCLSIDEFLAWERDIDRKWHSRLAEYQVSDLPEY
jgi:Protein of unknown function (DUF1153)